jgi:Spy/CpxP family protein refolding chaperone
MLAAFALTAGAASAQTTPTSSSMGHQGHMGQRGQGRMNMTPEQHADMQAQRLTKQLGLSADQTTQVRAIALAEAQEMKTTRDQAMASTDRKAGMEQMKATRDKYDTQLKAVLTPEQATKYAALRDQKMDKREGAMKDGKLKVKEGKVKAKMKS